MAKAGRLYVPLDTEFFRRPRIVRLGLEGRALYLAGLCWCKQQLTDGSIPYEALPSLVADAGIERRRVDKAVAALVLNDAWEANGEGWHVADWSQWNKTRAEIDEESERKRAAGKLGGRPKAEPEAHGKRGA